MRRFLFLLVLAVSGALRADLTYSVISGTPTNSINYINYEIGGYFFNQAGADVVVTGIGILKKSGNSGNRTMRIYSTSNVEVAIATVNLSGPEAVGDFVIGDITPSTFTIPAGSSYYILSEMTGGAQSFWAQQGITNTVPFGSIYMANRQGGTLSNQYPNGATQTWGPVTFRYSAPIANYSYNAGTHTYTFPGGADYFSVNTVMQLAVSGDIVDIGVGTNTWFTGGSTLTVKSGVTLKGATAATSIVNMSSSSVTGYSVASITLNEGSVVEDITINGPNLDNAVPFQTASTAGTWRLTRVIFNQYSGRQGYFINVNSAPSGLIEYCTITGSNGQSELCLIRGPSNAWQNPSGIGDANAVYIENNTFSGAGYVCDVNDNGKAVVRFNTITGAIKIDGHGRASNSIRGVRRLEAYNNRWTYPDGAWTAVEPRGGKNMLFNNVAESAIVGTADFTMRDYGYSAMFSGFLFRFQTPYNYPLLDQIGTGQDATVDATTLGAGRYVKIASVGTTDYTLVGASSNTVGLWFFLTGTPSGSGTLTTNGPPDPSYVWGNRKGSSVWARKVVPMPASATYTTNSAGYSIGATSITFNTFGTNTYLANAVAFSGDTNRYVFTNSQLSPGPKTMTIASPGLLVAIPASATSATVSAQTQYQQQLGNSSASFIESDIVEVARDFESDTGFDTSGPANVTVGLAAGMAGTPATLNHGYVATDEGSWNQFFSGTVGASSLAANYWCEIVSLGDTNWQAIGAPTGAVVGTQFTATEAGSGTGTAKPAHGRLYIGNGTNWVLAYTPYTFPYSEDPPPPTPIFSSAATNTDGDEISITFSLSCTTGPGGNGGITISATGGAVTWTYVDGSGTDTYRGSLSRVIYPDEDVLVSYAQPGDGIRSTDDEIDVDSFDLLPVINNSSAGLTVNVTTLNVDALIIGN